MDFVIQNGFLIQNWLFDVKYPELQIHFSKLWNILQQVHQTYLDTLYAQKKENFHFSSDSKCEKLETHQKIKR